VKAMRRRTALQKDFVRNACGYPLGSRQPWQCDASSCRFFAFSMRILFRVLIQSAPLRSVMTRIFRSFILANSIGEGLEKQAS
jgi:hypothetical protein